MCIWCSFPRALRAEGERCTGQKASLCTLSPQEPGNPSTQEKRSRFLCTLVALAAQWVSAALQ